MRHLSILLACLVLSPLTLAAVASAQDHDRGRAERASEVEVMDFVDGDHVEGDLVGPLGDLVRGAHGHARRSLIRPRAHFHQEMLKSVETL